MSKNLGKHILGGFHPNFARSYDTSMRHSLYSAEREENKKYNEEQKRLEDERKAAEQEKSMETVNRLLQGGRSGQTLRGGKPMFAPDSKQTQMNIMSGMSAADINKYQDIKKEFEPPKDEIVYNPNLPTVYKKDPSGKLFDTGEPNPLFQDEVLETIQGKKNGRKASFITYKSGKTKEVISPFYDDVPKIEKRKLIDNYSKEIEKIETAKFDFQKNNALYTEDEKTNIKTLLNGRINEKRTELYYQFNDKQKAFIDAQYDELKNTAKEQGYSSIDEAESFSQDELRISVIGPVMDMISNGKFDWEEGQAVLNYYKLKYGYIQ